MSTNSVTTPPACNSGSTTTEPSATLAADSISNILNHTEGKRTLHWWFFGPVLLAIMMFLLMGTIFERRIESLWRRILERRQAVLVQAVESQQPLLNNISLPTINTPSQRTLGCCKAGTTTSGDNDGKLEPKNFCCSHDTKEQGDDDLIKKDITERPVPLLM